MKLLKKQKLMLLTLCWALPSCVSAPPDFMACADLGDAGHCVTYVTKKKSDVVGESWKKLRSGSVLLPSDQFVKLKTFLDNYCHQNHCPNNVGDWNSMASELSRSAP